ncbi:MAG: HAD family hydrolase [Ichthyobacteriaceae bacterium]|nr:HAD family hydrolase [Ichthyobacteriaceae bacterium]
MDTLNKVFVFDLDDTLYKEIDYLKSAYKTIVKTVKIDFDTNLSFSKLYTKYSNQENVFEYIISVNKDIPLDYLLNIYRFHFPDINISNSIFNFLGKLKQCNYKIGVITDGRSITQRNKLKALGIENLVDEILISEEFGSEKPNDNNYLFFQNKYPAYKYFYIGDNVRKDFVTPNKLGWNTIGVKDIDNVNIHTQKIDVKDVFLPNIWVEKITEINY